LLLLFSHCFFFFAYCYYSSLFSHGVVLFMWWSNSITKFDSN
jgi:hypothetical protein